MRKVRGFVNNMLLIYQWFAHHPLVASAVFFAVATTTVTLYTYIVDHRLLVKRS